MDGHWGWASVSAKDKGEEQGLTELSYDGSAVPVPEKGMTREKEGREERRFDKVLVDAECTHDGSVRHIAKIGEQCPTFSGWVRGVRVRCVAVTESLEAGRKGWEQLETRTFEEGRMEGLQVRNHRGIMMQTLNPTTTIDPEPNYNPHAIYNRP